MTGIALLLFFLAQDDTAGRILQIGVTPSERVSPPPQIAPGAPLLYLPLPPSKTHAQLTLRLPLSLPFAKDSALTGPPK